MNSGLKNTNAILMTALGAGVKCRSVFTEFKIKPASEALFAKRRALSEFEGLNILT